MDGLSIATAVVTFGELAKAIKESIEKVGENKKNLADLQRQVEDTVRELERLAQGHGGNVPTGELLTALNNLMAQLKTVNTNCQELARTHATGLPGWVKSWFKREKIEAEIKKLKDNGKDCCAQFQLLSLTRVERHAARTEGTTTRMEGRVVQIEATTAQTKATASRTEDHAVQIKVTTAQIEGNTVQLVTSDREKKIREWFQALDMREKQHVTHALRHSDTGRWVLDGTDFVKWEEQPGCLWIRGNSGTGKSVLSSIAIDHLFRYRREKIVNMQLATPNFGIAYFYFDFSDVQKQLPENMLRSIIMQLSEQSPEPYSVLNQQFKSCQGQIFPPYDDLLAMLAKILSQFGGTYIVLDALDECSDPDKLIQFISTLRGWDKPVHLLVTSQPRAVFVDSTVFAGASIVVLERDTTHADITQFVTSELELNSKLKHLKKAKDAAPKIVDKSNGMFRMAACLLQELTRKRVDANVDKILAKLPNDLFGIYARFLQPIDEDDFVYVAALLRWLVCSARPVTLSQLDEALAIDFSDRDQWVFEPENRGRVQDVCGLLEGLIAIGPAISTSYQAQKEGSVVTLAHSSVADYIISKKFMDGYKHDLGEAPSHTFLAQSCVAYLLHFENNPLNANTLPHYPMAPYAAEFWSHHLLRCHDRGVLQRSTMRLLEQGSHQLAALSCMWDVDHQWMTPDWSRHAPSPLYLCSVIGYVEGVEFLLENGVADVTESSALACAAWKGHTNIVSILLEHGADVNTVGRSGSALECAALAGHMDTLLILLKHGATVNAVSNSGSALQCAARKGHMDSVRILLDHGADVNAAGGEFGSALRWASREGHMDMVRFLVAHGADVADVLPCMALEGNLHIVRLLVEHGADANTAGRIYGRALPGAARSGHADVVRLLLEKGADVNAVSNSGSALQWAACLGHMDIIRLLLEKGADVNAVSNSGSTLQWAACLGHADIVRLLLEKGADVNTVDGIYGSALHGAARMGHVDIDRLLGTSVNKASGEVGSTLQGAARWGQVDVVRILLKKGADVNAVDAETDTALQIAVSYDYVDIVPILLEHGAEVNVGAKHSRSPLRTAVLRGHVEMVRILLGADLNAADGEFSRALEFARAEGHQDIIKLLREHAARSAGGSKQDSL